MVLLDAEELRNPPFFVVEIHLSLVTGYPTVPQSLGRSRTDNRSHTAVAGWTWRLASPKSENPLTARVIVNRVWMHHFGEPHGFDPERLRHAELATNHPELLDYLASRLEQGGWSLKTLHACSCFRATYQQASLDRPACRQGDPENRLLWRFPRRRLDLEAMRDSLLFVSGRLDQEDGWTPRGCCRRSQERAKDDLRPR